VRVRRVPFVEPTDVSAKLLTWRLRGGVGGGRVQSSEGRSKGAYVLRQAPSSSSTLSSTQRM
jgi:hypothetical protein